MGFNGCSVSERGNWQGGKNAALVCQVWKKHAQQAGLGGEGGGEDVPRVKTVLILSEYRLEV